MNDYRLIVREFGGPDVIVAERISPGPLAPGMARVRHRAIGVNFIDTYHRSGLYPLPLPAPLGVEAAGLVEAVGPDVTGLRVGDRVGYAIRQPGSYASWQDVSADRLVPIPDGIGDEAAAAMLLKGLTAETLIFACARIEPGQSALVLAAAGGMGRVLVQWLAAIGVRVVAHAGSEEKASIAKGLGADIALHCPFDELAATVREVTGGAGVDAAFDGVGAASWTASLDSIRRRGLMVSFGNASGPVPPVSPLELTRRGSLFLTRPQLFDYVDTREALLGSAARLFAAVGDGTLRIEIGLKRPLRDAAAAHALLESRQTTGSVILIP